MIEVTQVVPMSSALHRVECQESPYGCKSSQCNGASGFEEMIILGKENGRKTR